MNVKIDTIPYKNQKTDEIITYFTTDITNDRLRHVFFFVYILYVIVSITI